MRQAVAGRRAAAPRRARRLPRAFFARDTRRVARDLLGQVLVHLDQGVRRAVRIVETEAYHGPGDRASHARFGRTRRSAVMFGPPGHSYVYLIYGTAHCLNAVTGREGFPAAVLLRAGEPLENCLHPPRGPGNLCRALGVRRETHDGLDLCGEVLFLERGPGRRGPVLASTRVNVHYAGPWAEKPWRYCLAESPWVSGPRPPPGGGRHGRRGGR
ncbi:MAG TPA: DNA-3-methyladenine glycosylase [Anaeromyxobacteraceae bacterium]|nr:DNA-3-methyladenine glycosylase [Anaeromyxobacteraceae bacterium]